MRDRCEVARRLGAHALRRRVRRRQVGIRLLQLLQLAEQAVVLGVGDLRRIGDVVEIVVVLDRPRAAWPRVRRLAAVLSRNLVQRITVRRARAFGAG